MLRRFVAAVILVPLAIIIIAFAVANRQTVTVSFDPVRSLPARHIRPRPGSSCRSSRALICGVVIGGLASWVRQGKWRGSARRFERELHKLREKVRALEGTAAKSANGPEAGRASAAPAAPAAGAIAEPFSRRTKPFSCRTKSARGCRTAAPVNRPDARSGRMPCRSSVKICGLSTPEALDVALDERADMVGFVFFPRVAASHRF